MRSLLLVVGLAFIPAVAGAGPIERACLKSERAAATPALCGCIQQIAGVTLSRSEQRQAARFFKDPHRSQEIRQSNRAAHEAFWQRYTRFAATAEANCS